MELRIKGAVRQNDNSAINPLGLVLGESGQASPRASFGLGNAQDIEEIVVNWPYGITQSFYNVAINRLAAISETNGFTGRKTPKNILRKLYSRAEKTNRRTGSNGYPHDNSGNILHPNDAELLNFTPRLGYNLFDEYQEGHGPFAPFAGTIESITGGAAHQSGQNHSANSATVQSLQLSTSYYLYSYDDRLLAEYDATGTCIKEYIYFGGKMVAEFQPQTNKYYYYHSDQINSTRVVTDDTGQKVYDHFYGPFGEYLKNFKETYDPKLKFSGKEREPEGELDYFGARYYNHQTYRFNAVDPIINKKEALTNTQLWNLYTYCRNNPLSYRDPDGRLEHFMFTLNNTPTGYLIGDGVVYPAFSGLSPHINRSAATAIKGTGPLPVGKWYIVDRPTGGRLGFLRDLLEGKSDWFALYREDGEINDETSVETYDSDSDSITEVKRTKIRLHSGSISKGCLTLFNKSDFKKLRKKLLSTKKEVIPGTNIQYYGTITVKRRSN